MTAGQSSQLSFWTAWDIEATFDGGIVQVSTDGGASWTLLTPGAPGTGYPNNVTQSGNGCSALQSPFPKPAFSSTSQFAWVQKFVNLSAYAGQSIRLAWRYGSDSSQNGEEGWYVDDIVLTHAQIPGACTSNLIFVDGFASGTFDAWSSTVP